MRVGFSELELTEKLAALVPPARKNRISYHGVLASNHRWRKQVVPNTPQSESRGLLRKDKPKLQSRWHPWADLLWRILQGELFAWLGVEHGGDLDPAPTSPRRDAR